MGICACPFGLVLRQQDDQELLESVNRANVLNRDLAEI